MTFPATKSNVVDGPPGSGTEIVAALINNLEDKVGINLDSNPASLDWMVRNHNHAGVYDPVGTGNAEATAHVAAHEAIFNHANYDTAYGWGNHAGLYDAAGVGHTEATDHVATHAALITGVHGLVFTAGKTLTLTESLTLNALPIGGLAVATAANTLGSLTVGLTTQYLAGGGVGTVPAWQTLNQAAVAGLTTTDGPTFNHLHLSGLTTSRIPYVGASNLITDSANFQWNNSATRAEIYGVYDAGLVLNCSRNPGNTSDESYIMYSGYDAASTSVKTGSISIHFADTTHLTGYSVMRLSASYMVAGVQIDDIFLRGWGNKGVRIFGNEATVPGTGIFEVIGEVSALTLKVATFAVTVEAASVLNQDLTTDASPTFATVKCSGLTGGYLPFHSSDAIGLADSPLQTNGTTISIGAGAGAGVAFKIAGDITTGVNQYALFGDSVLSGTTQSNLLYFGGTVKAGVTVSEWAGIRLDQGALGAGSAITTLYGIYIAAQTNGGTNYSIYSAGGNMYHAGKIGVGMLPTYNVDVTGNLRCSTGFGCNGKIPQTAYASGGALAAYATGAFGLDSDAHMSALHAMVVSIRAALVANGIMS